MFCVGEIAVTFTTSGNATTVKALDVPVGWTVTVTKDGAAGTFTITPPATASEGEAVIRVSDAAGKIAMRILRLTLNTSCAVWGSSGSFTQISNVSHENNTTMNRSTADAYCQNKGSGWRLPNKDELEYICNNKDDAGFPGGYVSNVNYWSSTLNDLTPYYYGVLFGSSCSTNYYTPSYLNYVKCVK